MSRKEEILELFQLYGGTVTLGILLKHPCGYKSTTRMSELRKEGYPIEFRKGKTASENSWHLKSFDAKGQGSLEL